MTYKLAKKLKDSGFPYEWDWKEMPKGSWGVSYNFPTLEELIEACGDGFGCLMRPREGGWEAISCGTVYDEFGKTPSEAVANLWLELNKKDG